MPIPSGEPASPPSPSIADKVRFLQSAAAYPPLQQAPRSLETHMSWLFFAGAHVLKLKKPVRFPFLDFSTLAAREFYCREELRLNSRLAPGVYLGLYGLQFGAGTLALVPEQGIPAAVGQTVDWLVLMKCLPPDRVLQLQLAQGRVRPADIDALGSVLTAFYRHAPRIALTAPEYLARFQRELAADREVLLRPQFNLRGAARALARLDAALLDDAALLGERAAGGRLVDGHGDLRPEHVWLLEPPVVIDCLEFNAPLRQVDPFDELAFLALECEMAGAAWIGARLAERFMAALDDTPPPALMNLYTAHRALLRARLAMAHLLDPQPRTPDRWPALAQRHIERASLALDKRPR